MVFVYLLKSVNGIYSYVGISKVPRRRLREHNRGENKTTRTHRPYDMWILARCETYAEARLLEKDFKTGYGRLKAERMIADGRAERVSDC